MKTHTFRIRIARMIDGFVQTVTYIGPKDRIPFGWSLVVCEVARRVVGSKAA